MAVYTQLERGPDDIGAAARGHHFLASGHECWAHDVGVFQTAAAAVALFEVADKRTIFERKCEHRLVRELERSREIFAQMVIDFVTAIVEYFPGIKNVFRIEHPFDFA